VLTVKNKRLLISEGRGDSNRCTTCRGKPDQYATPFPRKVRIWFSIIHISRGPRIATFCGLPTDLNGSHCSREKGLPTQSTSRRLTDPWVRIQFLSQANQWSSRLKPSFYQGQATRLIWPISSACDRYVQYLLTGPTHRPLTDTGGGYNLGGAILPHTTPRPSQQTVSTFHLSALPGLQFNNKPSKTSKVQVLRNLWPPRGLPNTRPSIATYNYT
jgi:hypothetical protein